MEEQENTEEIKSFEDLSKTENNENDMILPEKEVDDFGRSYATGKRKDAVARVWLKQGPGNITINGKSSDDYFARPVLRMLINQPLVASERKEQFDVVCSVTGGGLSGPVSYTHLTLPTKRIV